MLQIVDISEIKSRAEACGWSLGKLAEEAGVDRSAAYKAARGKSDCRVKTLRKLLGALSSIEQARAADLAKLHPREGRAA